MHIFVFLIKKLFFFFFFLWLTHIQAGTLLLQPFEQGVDRKLSKHDDDDTMQPILLENSEARKSCSRDQSPSNSSQRRLHEGKSHRDHLKSSNHHSQKEQSNKRIFVKKKIVCFKKIKLITLNKASTEVMKIAGMTMMQRKRYAKIFRTTDISVCDLV